MARTVRVRIAVAVDKGGNWHSQGWNGATDEVMASLASEVMASLTSGPGEIIHFVTAELPIPEPVEVEGTVEETA